MVFDQSYAAGYDALYRDKDYAGECDLVERALGLPAASRLLDIGCGTGGHAIELSRRDHAVTGVDLSPHMLQSARAKAARETGARVPPVFVQGDAREFSLPDEAPFDAAIMMFAVLGYLGTNADVMAALRSIRRRLKPEARFGFDVWWGPAVLVQQPGERVRVAPVPGGQLLRATRTTLDPMTNIAAVHFDLFHLDDQRPATRSEETHRMRFFFGPELELLLSSCGFRLERIGRFPEFDREPTTADWNAMVVARAV